jgi:hypothetical protein
MNADETFELQLARVAGTLKPGESVLFTSDGKPFAGPSTQPRRRKLSAFTPDLAHEENGSAGQGLIEDIRGDA